MTNGLEVLEIESTNGCDFVCAYDPQDFRDHFQESKVYESLGIPVGYELPE